MIRFLVEPLPAFLNDPEPKEHAVYIQSSRGGNDKALFLVFNAKEGAEETAAAFRFALKQFNDLHGKTE